MTGINIYLVNIYSTQIQPILCDFQRSNVLHSTFKINCTQIMLIDPISLTLTALCDKIMRKSIQEWLAIILKSFSFSYRSAFLPSIHFRSNLFHPHCFCRTLFLFLLQKQCIIIEIFFKFSSKVDKNNKLLFIE